MNHSLPAARLSWLLVFACLILAGCGDKPPKLPRLSSDATILAFGDSLTHGTGAADGQSYPAVLEQLAGRTVINAGVPGETTSQGLERLPSVLSEIKPDLVILCLGGNDFLRKHPVSLTRTNLDKMIRIVREQAIPLVLMGVPEIGLFSDSHSMYEALAKEHRLPIEDDILADVLHDSDLKSDPIHPNAEGYSEIAMALSKLLKATGAI